MAEKVRGTKRRITRIEPNTGTHPRDEKTSLDTLLLECGHILFVPSGNSPRQQVAQGLPVFVMCGQCGVQAEEPNAYTPPPTGMKEDVI